MDKIERISLKEAQKIAIISQKLHNSREKGTSLAKTLNIIEDLGYIQIDTLSVVSRAHDHTLWNRNRSYKPEHISKLLEDKSIFEYWSHAASYLPMKDFRFSLYRKNNILNGSHNHWYHRDEKLMSYIIDRIKTEGPLMARDFVGEKSKEMWSTKPAKQALENLFMDGTLMISNRKNFQKIYDLTERVLPENINTTPPGREEFIQYKILSYIKANGFGLSENFLYLQKGLKSQIKPVINDLIDNGQLLKVKIDDVIYYTTNQSLALLNQRFFSKKVNILSPFDNLIIQRKRINNIFKFDYFLECYVPQKKRVFGYFVLPILWQGKLVAKIDLKADRNSSTLIIKSFHIENNFKPDDLFYIKLKEELENFMIFNNCNYVENRVINELSF